MRAVRDRRRERLRRCDVGDLGARLAPDPVALALEVVDVAVVHQTVDERGRDGTVVQHAAPFGEALVRGDDRRLLLVPRGDQLVEDGPDLGIRGQVAEFVDLCGAPHNSTHVKHLVM